MYFLRSTSPATISPICGCMSGSPPGIETTGAPHSSTALKHSSGERFFFKMCDATVHICEIGPATLASKPILKCRFRYSVYICDHAPIRRQCDQREVVAIHVVREIEHAREAGAGVFPLVPTAIFPLCAQ